MPSDNLKEYHLSQAQTSQGKPSQPVFFGKAYQKENCQGKNRGGKKRWDKEKEQMSRSPRVLGCFLFKRNLEFLGTF